jgi:hypothetical protein
MNVKLILPVVMATLMMACTSDKSFDARAWDEYQTLANQIQQALNNPFAANTLTRLSRLKMKCSTYR